MKVLICGSREWPESEISQVHTAIDQLPQNAQIIAGAARGVDSLAASYARKRGLEVIEFPANWTKYGKSAGYKRNDEMLAQQPDLVIAFWNNNSRGTAHTIRQALRLDIETKIIRASN